MKDEVSERVIKAVVAQSPYDFFRYWVGITKMKEYDDYSFNPHSKTCEEDKEHIKEVGDIALIMLKEEKFRLFELDKDLLPMFETTDNVFFYRHTPFNALFINNNFRKGDYLIKGILVFDLSAFLQFKNSYEISKDVGIIFLAINEKVFDGEFYNYILLENDVIGYENSPEEVKDLRVFTRTIVANFLDFLEEEKDYEVSEFPVDVVRDKKRLKRGKSPVPHRIFIKLSGKMKIRAGIFNQKAEMFKYSHKFLVRGFWRHYRSDRYVNVKGRKAWQYPFWKGEGIKVVKDYKVKV